MPDPEVDTEVSDKEAEETHEGFVSDELHGQRIGVQHKKFREEQRGREAAEERLSTTQKELDELKGQQAEVEIPAVPDPNSETYQADVKVRDEAIAAKADQSAEQQRKEDDRKKEDEARVAKEDAAIKEKVVAFDSNMVTHGLNPNEVKAAADTVLGYGISDNFQDILLEDKDGPLFVQYLAKNPIELEEMSGMSALQLVNHLNGDIRAKALLLKPQTSTAPEPPLTLTGGGAPETKEDWEKGAKYE